MDKGFYSEDNINSFYKERFKFLLAVKMSLTFVKNELDTIYDNFRTFENYTDKYELYSRTLSTKWAYTQKYSSNNKNTS